MLYLGLSTQAFIAFVQRWSHLQAASKSKCQNAAVVAVHKELWLSKHFSTAQQFKNLSSFATSAPHWCPWPVSDPVPVLLHLHCLNHTAEM